MMTKPDAAGAQAEPRFGTVAAELGGTEFDNFERWFDGQNNLPCRAARRTAK